MNSSNWWTRILFVYRAFLAVLHKNKLQKCGIKISSNPNIIYASNRHSGNPPINEWIFFNNTNDKTNRIEFYITGIILDYPTNSPTFAPIKSPSNMPTLHPAKITTKFPTAIKSPTLYPTRICDEIRINVPNGFNDQIAIEIFNTPFIYHNTKCKNGYTGIIYFNGNNEWIISIHSQNNDYYKIYNTKSESKSIPFTNIWIDIDTQKGISESKYQLILKGNNVLTLPPNSMSNTLNVKKIETEYIYVKTWFWITIILIILFIGVICLLIWIVLQRRKRELTNNNNNNNGEDLVSEHVPKHQPLPTHSNTITPKNENEIQKPNALIPVLSGSNDNIEPITPKDGNVHETTTGLDWNNENDKIFSV